MKKKETCPECSVYTLSLKPNVINIIWDEQNTLKKNKFPQHKRTVEFLVNRIIAEWSGKENDNGCLITTLTMCGVSLTVINDIKEKHKSGTGETLSNQQAFNYIMNDYNNLRNK